MKKLSRGFLLGFALLLSAGSAVWAAPSETVIQNVCEGAKSEYLKAYRAQSTSEEFQTFLEYNADSNPKLLREARESFEKGKGKMNIELTEEDRKAKRALPQGYSIEGLSFQNCYEAAKEFENAKALFEELGKYLPLTTRNYDPIYTDKNLVMQAGDNFMGDNEDRLRDMFSWRNGKLMRTINRILGGIGIIYLIVLGIKFIIAQGQDERISKYKEQFGWIILGLAIISVAEFVGFKVLDPVNRDLLQGNDGAVPNMYQKVKQIVRFFEYIVGGFMLLNGLMSGYNLIIRGQKEEAISQEKQFLQSFLLGAIFILMAEVFIRIFSFKEGVEMTGLIFAAEVGGLINFMLSFVAIVATVMLIFSSLYYVMSFGNEDQMNRAKRILMANVLGVIISFSAYTIARFLINS